MENGTRREKARAQFPLIAEFVDRLKPVFGEVRVTGLIYNGTKAGRIDDAVGVIPVLGASDWNKMIDERGVRGTKKRK